MISFRDLALTEGLIKPPKNLADIIYKDAVSIRYGILFNKIEAAEEFYNSILEKYFQYQKQFRKLLLTNARRLLEEKVLTETQFKTNWFRALPREDVYALMYESVESFFTITNFTLELTKEKLTLYFDPTGKQEEVYEFKRSLDDESIIEEIRNVALEVTETETNDFTVYFKEIINSIENKDVVKEKTSEEDIELTKYNGSIYRPVKKHYDLKYFVNDFLDIDNESKVLEAVRSLEPLTVEFYISYSHEYSKNNFVTITGDAWVGLYASLEPKNPKPHVKILLTSYSKTLDPWTIGDELKTTREVVFHELIHLKQDMLNFIRKVKPISGNITFGMPSKKIQDKSTAKEHPLRNVEFYTNLHDSYMRFKENLKYIYQPGKKVELFKKFVGLIPDSHYNDQNFLFLKTRNFNKWKKAVVLLFKQLKEEDLFSDPAP